MLSFTACPDYSGKSRLSAVKAGFAGKNISLLLISCLVYSLSTLAQWQSHQPFTTLDLNNACYSDGQNMFIVGEFGSIFYLPDTSSTWQSIYLQNTGTLNSIYNVNDIIGYVVGDSGKIFRINFRTKLPEDISIADCFHLKDVTFKDYYNGIAVGTKQVRIDGRTYFLPSIHITTDAGLNWVEESFDIRGKLNSVAYFGEENIIAVGDSGKAYIFRESVWTPLNLEISTNLHDVKFCPDSIGIIVGEHGTVIISYDGWNSWTLISVPEHYHFKSVCSKDTYKFEAAGYMRVRIDGRYFNVATIFNSDNGGVDWNECFISERGAINCVSFCNPNLAIAVGDSGLVAMYESPTSFGVNNDNAVTNFILEQNYPNPFNPSTTISWQSPVGSKQTLKIYDVLGKEVAALVNDFKPAGKYETEFNAANLPSGIYFYQLKTGDFVETKKMILLR